MARRRTRSSPGALLAAASADALAAFPPAIAEGMRRLGVLQRWADGGLMFRRGERVTRLYLLLRGRIRIAFAGDGGNDLFIRWSQPGEFIGIVSVMTERPFPVDAVAFDHAEALSFEWEPLRTLLESDGRAAMQVAAILGGHASDMTNLIIARTAHTLPERVMAVLEHLALLNAVPWQGGEQALPVLQSDIAHAVGASRQAVNAALRRLAQEGRLKLGYRSVSLLAPRQLPSG